MSRRGSSRRTARAKRSGLRADRLFVPLASMPFLAFVSGRKSVEIRRDAPRWGPRHVFSGRRVVLRRGYGTSDEFIGIVGQVVRVADVALLPRWARVGSLIDEVGDIAVDRYRIAGCPVVAFEVLRTGRATCQGDDFWEATGLFDHVFAEARHHALYTGHVVKVVNK